jgi:hypothetical protein
MLKLHSNEKLYPLFHHSFDFPAQAALCSVLRRAQWLGRC